MEGFLPPAETVWFRRQPSPFVPPTIILASTPTGSHEVDIEVLLLVSFLPEPFHTPSWFHRRAKEGRKGKGGRSGREEGDGKFSLVCSTYPLEAVVYLELSRLEPPRAASDGLASILQLLSAG